MKKLLLFGNEAIALGAYHAGATVGTGYPGTPSTEILENFKKFKDVYSEWSINEKVALEVAIGSSLTGARTLVTMKHVGLNVAADPLFTASYTGVKGGLVIVCADDPYMHSSQNEQDNRYYAKSAKLPMLDPSDSQEAYDFTKYAFELSEKYDTPVILRTTTRISHSKSVVIDSNERSEKKDFIFEKNPKKYVMIPAYARARHFDVEKRLQDIETDSNNFDINKMEIKSNEIGFITSGICYAYLKEVMPEASVLKLGVINPLPKKLIKDFCSKVKKVYVIEELDPFFEDQIKAMGIKVIGKEVFPITGELNPDIIKNFFNNIKKEENTNISVKIPPRPPQLCPGCPHRTVFSILSKSGLVVSGDIGCYTLGVMPPFTAIDTCIDMGASIGVAQGMEIVLKDKNKTVAVIGDSTFAHSGITSLFNAAYNKRNILTIVLDNGTTAMTGMQPNPFSGETINNEPTMQIDYEKLAGSIGIVSPNFRVVDAYKSEDVEKAIKELIDSKKLSLLVVKGPCVILKRKKKES
ncbi:MAG TPA: thiamine pyrophosphate-dependent enzyme [Spirochaetota bacterium]|nr:thiamine pyrophosphate-dependent enzyme [Spirochaetota bacterium]